MIAPILVAAALSAGPLPAAMQTLLAAKPKANQVAHPTSKAGAQTPAASATEAATPAPAAKAVEAKPAQPAAAQPAAPLTPTPVAPVAAQPAPPAARPMDPEVQKAVDQMQRFYEETKDFEAQFKQTYTYKSFGRKTEASGRVRFLKTGASMRWDYLKPGEKVFIVAGNKVYAYDKEAKQLTVSPISMERLSASITFLWGQGKLEREFDIKKAERKDLTGGIALELTPKQPDPRFQKVFMLIDPANYAVKESIVVDPDGSENRMAFSGVKTNTGFGTEAFHIEPSPDTQVIRMDGQGQAPAPIPEPAPAPAPKGK